MRCPEKTRRWEGLFSSAPILIMSAQNVSIRVKTVTRFTEEVQWVSAGKMESGMKVLLCDGFRKKVDFLHLFIWQISNNLT